MERLTDRKRAQTLKDNAEKLEAAGFAVESSHKIYIRLSAYEDAEQAIIGAIKMRREFEKNIDQTAYEKGIEYGLKYALYLLKEARREETEE